MHTQARSPSTRAHFRLQAVSWACAWAATAVLLPTQAHAQSAPETAEKKIERLDQIIVTVQKVAQPASKTPLALTVLDGEQLRAAGASSATNLTDLMPNVQIGGGAQGATEIAIRGIGSTNNTEVGDPAAAFNVDGVYIGRPQSAGATFFDLARVEVLRGPQGTLYGRNATAGAINLVTNKPEFKMAGSTNLELGSYGLRKFEGMLNLPVNDMLALRGVVSSTTRKGFLSTANAANAFGNNRDDADNTSARVHALLKISPAMSLLLTADTSKDGGAGPGSIGRAAYFNSSGDAQREAKPTIEGRRDEATNGFSAEFKANIGFADFTYLGAKRSFSRDNQSSTGNSPLFANTVSQFDQSSHEFRLSNSAADLTWVAGFYLFNEDGNIDFNVPRFPVNASITGIRFKQDPMSNKSRAVFGQATYSVAPGLRLTLGLRQTTDDKSRIGGNFAGPTAIKIATNNASVNFTNSSYKVGADYDLSKTALAYASIATGYKAGGFYDGVKTSTFDNTYKPERLQAFEAGIKGRFLDNKLRLNAAFYNYSYQDLQISYIAINPGSGTAGTIVSNAARAGARGIELEGRFAVSEAGAVNFAIGTNDAKYKSFVFPATAGVRAAAVDFAGKALDKAPQSTLTLGYTHDFNLAGGAGVTAFVGTRYSSAYVVSNFAGANPVQYTQDAFNKTDFNVTYNEPGNRWYAQIFGKNLQNRNVIMAYAPSSNPALDGVFLGEPRTVGMRAGLKF